MQRCEYPYVVVKGAGRVTRPLKESRHPDISVSTAQGSKT